MSCSSSFFQPVWKLPSKPDPPACQILMITGLWFPCHPSWRSSSGLTELLSSYKEWFRTISYRAIRKPTEPELQLEHIFFTEQQKSPSIAIEKQVKPVKNRRRHQLLRELDERSAFMEYLRSQRENYDFFLSESQYLYGNDL